MVQSKALEVNLATYRFEVSIDEKYMVIQDVMSRYYGIMEGVNIFLKELSHPHRNLPFIVREARSYSLNYFHLIQAHEQGTEAALRFVEIYLDAIGEAGDEGTRTDAADNLLFFLQKIIKESGKAFRQFAPVLQRAFEKIMLLDPDDFFLFVKSYYPLDRLAELMVKTIEDQTVDQIPDQGEAVADLLSALNRLLGIYYGQTYGYWLSASDPGEWFKGEAGKDVSPDILAPIFKEVSHSRILELQNRLKELFDSEAEEGIALTRALLELSGYNDIAGAYQEIPRRLFETGKEKSRGNLWKVIFLLHIMNLGGLSVIHEDALREINRTLTWLISNEKNLNLEKLIEKTFSILKARIVLYPATVLNCVLNMGKGIYRTDDSEMINFFIDSVIDLGFRRPMIRGVGNDWQIQVNPAHILNIRTWMELIGFNPIYSSRLLSALIINLSLGGVFIKDTDLFPRDITRLLNARIEPVYNLAKQLLKVFPVYFNDIGAEGDLRDISTKLDEITHRKDKLIHFLRKQIHVESSNRIVGFMEAIFCFWAARERGVLEPFLPPSIYEEIESQGIYTDGLHAAAVFLEAEGVDFPGGLLIRSQEALNQLLQKAGEIRGIPESEIERFRLAIALYKLIRQKYEPALFGADEELDHYLNGLRCEAFPDLNRLRRAFREKDLKSRLFQLLDYLEDLKSIVISPQTYEIREDIYKKRHFAIDIPSMYGSYHETKFDAMGLTFRLESLVNVLLEQLIENIDLTLVTKATFYQIYDKLILFDKALKVDGIVASEFESQIDLLAHSLEVRGFTFTQYLDIFKGLVRAVKNIISDFFNNIHEENLVRILSAIPEAEIQSKYLSPELADDPEKAGHGVSEIFLREKLAHSLGLQQLDRFLSRILHTLFQQSHKLASDRLKLLLNYDPQRAMMSIVQPSSRAAGIIYLGSKGFNLVKLRNFGFSVPPGFIITTEAFRCRSIIETYPPARLNLREQLSEHISLMEMVTGKQFGDPKNPLLFSVRSGSSISQPGMMDTFLNVGINEEITQGLAEQSENSWFAWDSYRRFLQSYGMAHGLARDQFDSIIRTFKELWDIPLKKEFPGEMMRSIALDYKRLIEETGIEIVSNPFEQLLTVIWMVFDSWNSSKAKTYRRIMGISDDWGTAVTIQSMVFGNRSRQSGTGVFFTHNPRWPGDDTVRLWGDFSLENQGEDVVSGLVHTLPISISQQNIEMRDTDTTLETHFPEIYKTLKEWAEDLIYKKRWSPQEMEFTFESPDPEHLFLLQTRDMAIRERKKVAIFRSEELAEQKVLGTGIGVSGGAMSGRVVFTLEEIDGWRREEADTSLILFRADTVPDDIREINAADGVLTARGGLTSHAAVVAHRLGKTCIVGCGGFVCKESEKIGIFDGVTLRSGDFISIDGQEGTVYQGRMTIDANP